MANLFAPRLIAEFGWERSDFALIGMMPLVIMLVLPLQGRFTDRFGPRRAAAIGVVVLPFTFLAFSMMQGNIVEYFVIAFCQALVAMLVGTLAYTRVVVERFDLARGVALATAMVGAPAIGALLAPVIGAVIAAEGWRAGYQVLAVLSATGGALALLLIGKSKVRGDAPAPGSEAPAQPAARTGTMFEDVRVLLRQRTFRLMMLGMLFCNFPHVIVGSQIKLLMLENGASMQLATLIVSLYATGVVIGRIGSGIALDRIAPHLVAAVTLSFPAVGLLAIASPYDASWLLAGSILLVGMAQGAEGDIGAYLTSRNFDIGQYSFVFALINSAMLLSAAIGSLVLSVILARTGTYDLFLVIAAVLTMVGSIAFYLNGSSRRGSEDAAASLTASAARK